MKSMDTKAKIGLRVQKMHGEQFRQILLRSDLMDHQYQIRPDGDSIIIPLIPDVALGIIRSALEDNEIPFTLETYQFEVSKKRPVKDYREFLSDIPGDLYCFLPTSFDVIGSICLVKLHADIENYGVSIARAIMATHSSISGIFQDRGVTGEFRVRDLRHLAGAISTTTIHREYGLHLKVDVTEAYFSPRLAAERARIVSTILSEGESPPGPFLDMFAGVGPYAIAIARQHPNSIVHAIDINPRAIELMQQNIMLNKTENISSYCGDSREIVQELAQTMRFHTIIMNLPHDAIDFLSDALVAIDHGMIHLYSICPPEELSDREETIRSIINRSHTCNSIESSELKGYSPAESVYSHDLRVSPKLE